MALFNLCITISLFVLSFANGAKMPHILMMVVDDLGWADIGSHGAEYKTATIDSLISTGIELTNYHVHLDCSPTRSAFMTGQYSFKNGLQNWHTIGPATTEHIPFENPTVAELLQKAGYSTHMLGKWHLGYAAWNMTPTGRGFDSFFGYYNGAEDYYSHEFMQGYDFNLNHNVFKNADGKYSTELYNDYMKDLVTNYTNSGLSEPLFNYMAFQTVHTPIEISPNAHYDACDTIVNNGNRTIYCNKMQYLDNVINDMINLYKANNLWDDTFLIVSTDNGGMTYWGEGQNALVVSWGCNMPYRAGKVTLFNGGVKGVGFINGGNNVIPSNIRGTKSNILTHAIDWLPTIVEGFASQDLPDNVPFDGINMWSTLINQNDNNWNRTRLYLDIEQNGSFSGIIDGDYKFFQGQQMYTAYFPCNGTYTPYDNSSDTEIEWLFNLKSDPYETTNLAKTNPSLVTKYKNMIQDYINGDNGYMQEQDSSYHKEANPKNHNGDWVPWLD